MSISSVLTISLGPDVQLSEQPNCMIARRFSSQFNWMGMQYKCETLLFPYFQASFHLDEAQIECLNNSEVKVIGSQIVDFKQKVLKT